LLIKLVTPHYQFKYQTRESCGDKTLTSQWNYFIQLE